VNGKQWSLTISLPERLLTTLALASALLTWELPSSAVVLAAEAVVDFQAWPVASEVELAEGAMVAAEVLRGAVMAVTVHSWPMHDAHHDWLGYRPKCRTEYFCLSEEIAGRSARQL